VGEAPTIAGSTVAANASGSGVKVLVVDDDERNLIAITSILDDIAEVVTATSGDAALRQLLAGEFAVILLDVIMPGMDGYETATLIRGREQTRRIPIIFLSAINKDEPHLMRGYSMGAVDYVFKPVEPLVLRSKVSVFVDLFQMSREIQAKAKRERALLDDNLRIQAERLDAERSLRESEVRQAAIIESLPIVLYLDDRRFEDRRILAAGRISALLGAASGRALEDWRELIHPEDREKVAAALERREKDGQMVVEYRLRGGDGAYRHILDQSARLDDETSRFAGTLLDISDRKALESQLVQAQKMDALGKLTGGIAHDFNNLLAAVISGVTLLERRLELSDEHKKITQMTRRAAEQGAELVERLLAFSRTQRLEPSRVDLGRLSANVRDLLEHALGGRIRLDWAVAKDAWAPYADQSQLELAVMNLVINARDAMPEGGTIRITAANRRLKRENEHGLAAGAYAVLTVADEGCGMADDVLELVMEPFFTTKEIGKGTGLGLSMVYGFAVQSGGALDIESELGAGTSVHIWLPRSPAGQGASVRAVLDQTPAPEKFEEAIRVLLADDHAGVRQATAGLLQELGASVVDVESGEAMLAEFESNPGAYDAIITDFAMPGLPGDEVVCRARAITNQVAAVIITGHANSKALVSLPERTFLLNKPFTPAKLLHAVKSAQELAQA
jgi:signal transduction histidine kinase